MRSQRSANPIACVTNMFSHRLWSRLSLTLLASSYFAFNCSMRESNIVHGTVNMRVVRNNTVNWHEAVISRALSSTVLSYSEGGHIWMAGSGNIAYRTHSPREDWEKVSLPFQSNIRVADIECVSDSEIWILAFQEATGYFDVAENISYVVFSSNGGESWSVKYRKTGRRIDGLVYSDARDVWAFGTRFVLGETFYQEYVLIKTENQGKDWGDISDKLASLKSCSEVSDSIVDVQIINRSNIKLLSIRGVIFTTTDEGKTWQIEAHEKNDDLVALKLGAAGANARWILSGVDGTSGIRARLAVADKDEVKTVYLVNLVFLTDVAFLQGQMILATGSMPPLDSPFYPADGNRDGIILLSKDSGRNWEIIYRSENAGSLDRLSIIDNKYILASGPGGVVVSGELLTFSLSA